ncbi:hypothetical protein E4U54_003929 [Claviceps lovelessii]|nr:hypothetical protein E4U54_003929 [Claviceps lovelessii]
MMLRRRYRLFLLAAVVILIVLYKTSQSSGNAPQLKHAALKQPQRPAEAHVSNTDQSGSHASGRSSARPQDKTRPAAVGAAKLTTNPGGDGTGADKDQQLSSRTGADGPSKNNIGPAIDSTLRKADTEKPLGQAENPRPPKPKGVGVGAGATPEKVSWTKPKEHFPVPKKSIVTLPAGPAKKIPKIQHTFPAEAEGPKKKRLQRQEKVKEEIRRSWAGYKRYAWMHDELSPVTNRSRDPFCGWAATLVDSLDTLWIAGLKDEFDEAAAAAKTIDFTYTTKSKIPIFETTIRYLGGLIAAYDVSGGASGQYSFLLDKAVELGEILMGIFDTPNRMPVLYYPWRPEDTSKPRRAKEAGMAELATLSLEFTRLAQITGQDKYYDAIDRITDALIDMQRRGTLMPGLFPENLDISGCNKTAEAEKKSQGKASESRVDSAGKLGNAAGHAKTSSDTSVEDGLRQRFSPSSGGKSFKREFAAGSGLGNGDDFEWDCVPQPLVPAEDGSQKYHMGGAQDSAYEYFGKEYLLLGGREKKYQKLYEDTVDGINKHLLYRPMISGDWDIIFPAKVKLREKVDFEPDIEYEVTHLTCFIGGMYALGGKLFGREKDLKYAEKLTNGCVWAYQSTATGLMPEAGNVVPCPTFEQCSFNKTLWWQKLDPYFESRAQNVLDWEKREKLLEQEELQKREAEPQEEDSDPATPSGPSLAINDASREDVDVEAEKRLDDDTAMSHPTRDQLSKTDLKLPTLKEDYHPRAGAPKFPEAKPHPRPPRSRKPVTHEEYVQGIIDNGMPQGYDKVVSKKYILRPEAIESVWYMYRITGDASWMEKGWTMFEATIKATRTATANSAIDDVLTKEYEPRNEMESFWLAETLKYYYLLFSEPSVISLDEWVLNTEAHPFNLKTKT